MGWWTACWLQANSFYWPSTCSYSVFLLHEMCNIRKPYNRSGFCCNVNEVFTLLGFYAAFIGRWLPMFWDSQSDPFSRVKQSRRLIGCPETSVTNYQTKLHNIPEEWKPHTMDSWRLLGGENDFTWNYTQTLVRNMFTWYKIVYLKNLNWLWFYENSSVAIIICFM